MEGIPPVAVIVSWHVDFMQANLVALEDRKTSEQLYLCTSKSHANNGY